ncbi:hypothetical protein KBTX_00880 [wastewater metagenome]|uniref:GGDEF domain-containing protein n=2 Tax=unclassified sequences TaxID=12908 RepID=A0A5B8RAZ1_9ZZZZ|nr:hypothetical protein KBTEX_00880 [uncultured organism]
MRRRKIYFAVALALLVATGLVATSLISYYVAHDSLAERVAEETLPLTSDNIYSEIQRDLLRSVLISSFMAHDTFVRDWAIGGEHNVQRMTRYLSEVRKKYDTITAFFVSERSRRYYHPRGVLKTVRPEDPQDAWYFRVRNMHDRYEINVDADTANPGRVSIFVNYRVLDYDGDYLGAIGVGLSVNAVADLIENYQRRYGRRIYFIDREGDVTLHGSAFDVAPNIHDREGLGAYATRILTSPSTSFRFNRGAAETVYVNTRLVPQMDWILVVEQSNAAAEARIQRTLAVNLAISLAITVLVLTLGYITVRGYQRRLEEMATTDPLTGAASRQVFGMVFDQVVRSARRRGEAVSVLSVDIDRFKAINDTHGHQAGDQVIRSVVDTVRRHIREADTVCRWGGEEFIVLLGDCSAAGAAERAETLRAALADLTVPVAGTHVRITVSIGVAECAPGESLEAVMQRVDAALYAAKRDGRNRVVTA